MQPMPPPPAQPGNIWYQNFYRIRKKVLTVGNKYWIEDYNGHILGFSKQKLFKLKEDIRIYSDESMSQELFRIGQQQIMDMWGNFAVIDSSTNAHLGYIKRKALMSGFIKDEWEIYNAANQQIGRIYESTVGGLLRKRLPGGSLIPEKTTLEIYGRPVAEINQKFKIIGDIWELNCQNVPQELDRRILLSCILLMGMIERGRK
ncbi:MAG: hypothetical protein COS08_03485 [Euryarchaeota archaeon CG01_land_8_20_14_3_00_38_12]|nr:MAG: hypothetical protein COS08_03485 [Euryarchaeota archaeon CG01_land_8_20_14_3_00_38_12]PJB20981.1 MAG: hypothetical protein CO114_07750 [Euryarchaeota archaeon CG_4_9_14_3_um_filter_38_12]